VFGDDHSSDTDRRVRLADWLVREGRFAADNTALLNEFCPLVITVGVPLDRCWLHVRAWHPDFAGVSRKWQRDAPVVTQFLPYGFETSDTYLRSTVRHVVERQEFCRWRLDQGDALPFPVLQEMREDGYRDYAIAPLVFSDGMAVNAVSWATRDPAGFADDDLRLLQQVLPTLSLTVETRSLRRFTSDLLGRYVGREPADLILQGQVRRGDVLTTTAALMLVDLRDFTAMSDALAPRAVIDTLNRYFDCIIAPVRHRDGEIMEIMGDAILVIFNESSRRDARDACRAAFEAAREGLAALEQSNAAQPPGGIQLRAGFALHHGQVSYGNIGAEDRLDFTVIGPDVNLTSRIERLCREMGRELIMSGDFAALLETDTHEIGHFHLRGFARMQMLFGLAPPDEPSQGRVYR
jgi:adenylate cyclase